MPDAAPSTPTPTPTVAESIALIDGELSELVSTMLASDATIDLDRVAERIAAASRVFVFGAGRSGLALRMTAMRLMHFGLTVHVVGETTTPAITTDDVLLTASGSGTTSAIVSAATTARDSGAHVVALTTDAESPLADLASECVIVPAAQKQDHSGSLSRQYAGGLFEHAIVIIGDGIFDALWRRSGVPADELWPRHANLE
ncbi:6-phospho-3-hexuloisomerase [Marisediminicola sp. LYQ85]|uniref:6-phospho-3-hexuloisomerase n=1 Tax=Marisediminicola sp. LYQ85 TaxID=3391062 RepID=UPI0039833DD9